MQDRYVADVGDFAKYGLLRALSAGEVPLRLGILWYRFPDESHNGDGRHIAYLQQQQLASRDPELHAELALLIKTKRRSIATVESSSILPEDTLYFHDLVVTQGAPEVRIAYRSAWFQKGMDRLAAAELVFFDPDNGIETPALDKRSRKSGKYVFWSEIEAAWAAGKSLVIYNHLNRSAPAAVQTLRLAREFKTLLPDVGLIMPLLFRRGSCRHLWILVQPRHESLLESRARMFMQRGWSADAQMQVMRPQVGAHAAHSVR